MGIKQRQFSLHDNVNPKEIVKKWVSNNANFQCMIKSTQRK